MNTSQNQFRIVILGLSITSSWGNGHATTYRSLMRELCKRGHKVTFLERDVPWYAANRDLPNPPYGKTFLYTSISDLQKTYFAILENADVIIIGSYVPEGAEVGKWICDTFQGLKFFYDIDTPVTLAKLAKGNLDYLSRELIPDFDLYLSFTGGPILKVLENHFGARRAEPLYCSIDPEVYRPEDRILHWDAAYMGTYSPDRQVKMEQMFLPAAKMKPQLRWIVAGPGYPESVQWPHNVERIDHIPPERHCAFYNSQRFAINITRDDMTAAGYSPSIRLFEAAACGVPIISDRWSGMETFFVPESEILIADSAEDVLCYLMLAEDKRKQIGTRARNKVLTQHTGNHRAAELESYIGQCFATIEASEYAAKNTA
jgi:spore maturation protein CgeB